MRPILLIMWTTFQSFILRDNSNKDQALATINIQAKLNHPADSPVGNIVNGCEMLDDAVCMNMDSFLNLLLQ